MRLIRRLSAIGAAFGLLFVAAVPAYASGHCDPGRASNTNGFPASLYAESVAPSGHLMDDAHGRYHDLDYFTESGSESRAYIALRKDSSNYIRFGVTKSGSEFDVFYTYVNAGTIEYQNLNAGTNPDGLLNDPLDGDSSNGPGGETAGDKFAINYADLSPVFDGMELLINGTTWRTLDVPGGFKPTRARFGFEIDNGGSQWWGDENPGWWGKAWVDTDNANDYQNTSWNEVNATNKGRDNVYTSGTGHNGWITVWDADCV